MTLVRQRPNNYSLFDELFNNFPVSWGRDIDQGLAVPPVNIHETNEGYHLEMSAPGRSKEDFKINVENNLLTISFEKKEEISNKDHRTVRREFSFRSFKRSFSLDDKINTDAIEARYENGVLKLFLPRKDELKATPKQINIQ